MPIDLTYIGSFKFPVLSSSTGRQFEYAKGPFTATKDRMYLRGNSNYNQIAECAIPDPGGTASVIRWFDPSNGRIDALSPNSTQRVSHRGMFAADGGLYGFAQPFYNVSGLWLKSHWFADPTGFQGFAKTSIQPLKTAGFCGELPPALAQATGKDSWCFDCVPQGLSTTNNGPALYVFNRSKQIADESILQLTPVFEHPVSSPYDQWWGDRQINGACFTATHFVCAYSKTFGARWYGYNSNGRTYDERNTNVAAHPIETVLYADAHPGQIAVDTYDNSLSGYHAEQHALFLLVCSIESILAGAPVWSEIDMRPHGITGIRRWAAVDCDRQTGRLMVCEFRGDGTRPKVHVFQTAKESDMQELEALKAAVADMQAAITAKDQQIATLLESILKTGAERDALQGKINMAKAALD